MSRDVAIAAALALVLLVVYRRNQDMGGGSLMGQAWQPRGIRNNNPGNLEWLPPGRAWNGQIGSDGRFGVYDTPANGVRAMARQLLKYSREGLNTVRSIIAKWAPASENDVGAYARSVAARMGVGPDESISVSASLPRLVAAMIRHENGQQPYSMSDIERWVYL